MSSVYLHVGQCGVQIGQELWTSAAFKAQHNNDVKHTMWTLDGNPRCLFVDSEWKVIQKFANETKKCKHGPKIDVIGNSIRCRKGCGSNWALGYHNLATVTLGDDLPRLKAGFGKYMVDRDSSMLDVCMEGIRVKVESCDSFSGFVGVHSLGGGTGSGWGSRLCEELRDSYPTAYRLWNVVTPHSVGESPTQHYNQLLSLAKLQEAADAVVLFENDRVLQSVMKSKCDVALKDMNKLIADTMLSLYMPVTSLSPSGGGLSIGIEPWELIRSVAPMPSLKFLQTSHVDQSTLKDASTNEWDKIMRVLAGRIKGENRMNPGSCISAMSVFRGIQRHSIPDIKEVSKKLKTAYNCVTWNPYPIDVWLDGPRKVPKDTKRPNQKSVTVCANLTSSSAFLQNVTDKSRLMFDSKAYLHWYARYGSHHDDFINAFETLENVIGEYLQH